MPWMYECPPAYEQAVRKADDPRPDLREDIRNPESRLWVGVAPPAYGVVTGNQTDGVQQSVEAPDSPDSPDSSDTPNALDAPIDRAPNRRERLQALQRLSQADTRQGGYARSLKLDSGRWMIMDNDQSPTNPYRSVELCARIIEAETSPAGQEIQAILDRPWAFTWQQRHPRMELGDLLGKVEKALTVSSRHSMGRHWNPGSSNALLAEIAMELQHYRYCVMLPAQGSAHGLIKAQSTVRIIDGIECNASGTMMISFREPLYGRDERQPNCAAFWSGTGRPGSGDAGWMLPEPGFQFVFIGQR